MASTGFSFEALQAGYRAKIMLTASPKANAPVKTAGVKTGIIVSPLTAEAAALFPC